MDDPELERIFTETYRETMAHAETMEKKRRFTDQVEAYVELFERELFGKDLTESERTALTVAFERRLRDAEGIKESRLTARVRKRRRITGIAGALTVAVVCVLLVTYRPLKPLDTVTDNLDTYIAQVENGTGGFADDFYKLLNRFDRRLDDSVEETYRERMYNALDTRFGELLENLKEGDLTLFDDARKWAKLFPEKADRKARIELVENAGLKGLGGTARRVFDRLKSWGADAVEWVEEKVENDKSAE